MKWLTAALLAWFFLPAALIPAEQPVYFADAHLKAAVEAELGLTDPNAADMLLLITLNAGFRDITDLTGLEYAANLTDLDLLFNQVSDLTPLAGLINIAWLDLGNNQIIDLLPLAGLTNIKTLTLWGNQIDNLAPLANLTDLELLDLDNNRISNLAPLASLTNLLSLELGHNQISGLSSLAGLTHLSGLDLSYNQISDLSPLTVLTSLTRLYLLANPLNTGAYCRDIPLIVAHNPAVDLAYDPNPNPLTNDCSTDLVELQVLITHWLETDCGTANNWCGGADLNHINDVNIHDFAEFAAYWLVE